MDYCHKCTLNITNNYWKMIITQNYSKLSKWLVIYRCPHIVPVRFAAVANVIDDPASVIE